MSCASPGEVALPPGSSLGVKAAWYSWVQGYQLRFCPRDSCGTGFWPKASESRFRIAETWHAPSVREQMGRRQPGEGQEPMR